MPALLERKSFPPHLQRKRRRLVTPVVAKEVEYLFDATTTVVGRTVEYLFDSAAGVGRTMIYVLDVGHTLGIETAYPFAADHTGRDWTQRVRVTRTGTIKISRG